MKKTFSLIAIIIFILCLFNCQNPVLPTPKVTLQEDTTTEITDSTLWSAPQNLVASQGLKQKIKLSWNTVKSASRYYIYQSDSPFSNFTQAGETTSNINTFSFDDISGATRYYKVVAVKKTGEESPFSQIAMGTTLAQPVISSIEQNSDNSDSSAIVYWWMSNANSQTYINSLRYIVTCYDEKNNTVDEKIIDASITPETSTQFDNLQPNTNYFFTVEAYLVSSQSDSEESSKLDAKTARRLRPNAPENVVASEGTSKDTISIQFTLPQLVDVALTGGVYESHNLYFKIYRKISGSSNNYELIDSDFNVADFANQYAPTPGDLTYIDYIEGSTVTWTDNSSDIKRGIKYDYKIQSYADDIEREISSDFSYAETTAWKLATPSFSRGKSTLVNSENEEDKVDSISLTFNFSWDALGKESDFNFIISEKRYKLETDNNDEADTTGYDETYYKFSTIEEVNNFIRLFDFTKSEASSLRGYYIYKLYLVSTSEDSTAKDIIENDHFLEEVKATGKALVTDDAVLPVINNFSITNGYKNKIVLSWEYDSTITYSIEYTPKGSADSILITDLSSAINENTENGSTVSYSHEVDSGFEATYILKAYRNIEVTSDSTDGSTLGTANISFDVTKAQYDSISISWPKVNNAISYTLEYSYSDDCIAGPLDTTTLLIDDEKLIENADGSLTYTFTSIQGYDNAKYSGKDIIVTVESNSNVDSTSATVLAKTLGPALTNVSATQASYTNKIDVKWNTIKGATGYLVLRQRYDITNTSLITNNIYYIDANTLSISESGNTISTNVCQATESNSVITLTDFYSEKGSQASTYEDDQDKLAWGFPYHYTVFPVNNSSDTLEVEPSIKLAGKVTYTNLSDIAATGSALGYGHNVTATKAEDPNKVTITWTKPFIPDTLNVAPVLWRSVSGQNTWEKTEISLDGSGDKFVFIPKGNERIIPYDFAIKYSSTSTQPNQTYLDSLSATASEDTYNESINKGYAFALSCKAENVTSNGDATFSERITWEPWDYTTRARGPKTGNVYTVKILSPDFNSEYQTIATETLENIISIQNDDSYKLSITQSGNGLILTPTDVSSSQQTAIHSGLLKVLDNYKHYVKISVERDTEDGTIEASNSDNDDKFYTYRQITAAEFGLSSAKSIGESMYNGSYCSSEGSSYIWTFNFLNNGPYFLKISGTMTSSRHILVTGKPHTHGATATLFSGTNPSKATLTITPCDDIDLYSGTIEIESFCNEDGTFNSIYNGITVDSASQARNYIPFD